MHEEEISERLVLKKLFKMSYVFLIFVMERRNDRMLVKELVYLISKSLMHCKMIFHKDPHELVGHRIQVWFVKN